MKDALNQTEQALVRPTPSSQNGSSNEKTERLQEAGEAFKPVYGRRTVRQRSTKREEWRAESKGPDGQVVSAEGGLRESVSERKTTQSEDLEGDAVQKLSLSHQDINQKEDTHSTIESLNLVGDPDHEIGDESAVQEIAQEEFEWGEKRSEEGQPAIPVRTGTGRVYKSFEEMLSDPTYPMSPAGKVWQEDANTTDELVKTYRAIEVLDWKMKDLSAQYRQGIASAGWYAMLCIRNIYARLGDVVDTVSIERKRFVVIRLKSIETSDAEGRIVIAPSGAYAYSLHLPTQSILGHGGLEWGTMFFPLGSEIDSFEEFGWKKSI